MTYYIHVKPEHAERIYRNHSHYIGMLPRICDSANFPYKGNSFGYYDYWTDDDVPSYILNELKD